MYRLGAMKGLYALLPALALPTVVGEAAYLLLQAVHFDIGAAEIFRVVGAVGTAWMTLLTTMVWRTYMIVRADHRELHGTKDIPGVIARQLEMSDDVKGLPVVLEKRFDRAIDRMVVMQERLESRIERLENQSMNRGGSP